MKKEEKREIFVSFGSRLFVVETMRRRKNEIIQFFSLPRGVLAASSEEIFISHQLMLITQT